MRTFQLIRPIIPLLLLIPWLSCTPASGQKRVRSLSNSKEFKEYWYAGKAELNRYELEQARYGEIHKGEAVLIFVTEDFDTDKQVKHERGQRKNVASVLKLNATRKFFTGLYPYSMMSSIFTPVDNSATLKVTTSSQEWCGHTFSQFNLKRNRYDVQLRSYFQSEGDQDQSITKTMLEDEIWTKLRLDPNSLPTGEIEVIPGSFFSRLSHKDVAAAKAIASISSVANAALSSKPLKKYLLEYKDFERTLEIVFEDQFPFAIVAWEEKQRSGFGPSAKTLTTKATRTHTMKNDYWSKHDVADGDLRKQLGLEASNY